VGDDNAPLKLMASERFHRSSLPSPGDGALDALESLAIRQHSALASWFCSTRQRTRTVENQAGKWDKSLLTLPEYA
jgi:hypothetical protein